MKRIIIDNIPDEMFAHIVNGFARSGTAFLDLTASEQETLVGGKIYEWCGDVAKSHAVMVAQNEAARQTAETADAMIAQTKQVVTMRVEEVTP